MNGYQKALRVFSIIDIVVAVIVIIAGAIVLVAALSVGLDPTAQSGVAEGLAAEGMTEVDSGEVVWSVALMGWTVVALGIFLLVTGVFGLIAAKDDRRTMVLIVLSAIGLAISTLNVLSGMISGSFAVNSYGPSAIGAAFIDVILMGLLLIFGILVRMQERRSYS